MNQIIKQLTNELPALLSVWNITEDGSVVGAQLEFEQDMSLCVLVTEQDELVCTEELPSPELVLEPAEDMIWADARGKFMSWFWTLQNQAGYADGVQFEFGAAGENRVIVQLMAVGARLLTRRLPLKGTRFGQ